MTSPSPADVAARLSAWRPPAGTIGIVALGQAGFALRSGDDLVLIDPFLSPAPGRLSSPLVDPSRLDGITAVLATHEHSDHLDLATWAALGAACPAARFVAPEPLVPLATGAGIPADRVTGARLGAAIRVGGMRVVPVPAIHAVEIEDGYARAADGPHGARWMGYVVELDGIRIYHAGDTLADEPLVRAVAAARPDIALLPINGRDAEREGRGIVGNLTPDEAAALARDLSVDLAVPMHFDAVRGNLGHPDAFVRAMREVHPTASAWVPGAGAGLVWPAGGRAWRGGRA